VHTITDVRRLFLAIHNAIQMNRFDIDAATYQSIPQTIRDEFVEMVAFAREMRHRQHFGLATAEEYANANVDFSYISVPFILRRHTFIGIQVLEYRVLHGDHGYLLGRDQHRDREHHQRSVRSGRNLCDENQDCGSEVEYTHLQTQLITIFGKRFVYLTDEELTAWCQTPT
jgi:hypothetical protein